MGCRRSQRTSSRTWSKVNATGRIPVVFVHGLWLLPSSWDRWAEVFEEAGYAPLTPGWPDDPETVAEANANPEVFANKTVGEVADHFAEVIGKLDRKPAVIGHSFGGLLTQILAGRGLVDRHGRDRPGAVPRRAAAADLGAAVGQRRCSATRPTATAPCRSPTSSSATRSRTPSTRTRRRQLYDDVRRARPRRAAVPGGDRQPQPVDRGEGRHQEPRARTAADHLRREGPHRAVGDRERLVQEAEAATRASPRSSRSRTAATRSTIDSGWREVADTALEFVRRFT